MCFSRKDTAAPAVQTVIAKPDGAQSTQAGTMQDVLRRRRAGAAADILTGPVGIPATSTLGGRN